MNKIIWVKIYSKSYYNILIKLNEIGISLYDNKKYKDYILIKIDYEDYKRIKKYLLSYKIEIDSLSGIGKVEETIKKYIVFFLTSIISIAILLLVNNMIFKIDVKSSNKNIQKLVLNELDKNNIHPFILKIRHKKVENIVKKILDDNKDTLEWLEIKYDGLIMNVYVTEKTITNNEEVYDHCNIIATTDAKITNMNIYRGVALKEINDYVLKGDVILSGDIIYNEEVKNNVCASGEIYGEVWYKVKVTVPFKENYIDYTGKNRYNFNIKINENKYDIFKSRIQNRKIEETNLYKLNDFEINLVKEKEYVRKEHILTEEEAYNKGFNRAIEKVELTLDKTEEILEKKVLKKEVNDSTIYLEIFIVTKENIGKVDVIKEEINNGNGNSTQNSQ